MPKYHPSSCQQHLLTHIDLRISQNNQTQNEEYAYNYDDSTESVEPTIGDFVDQYRRVLELLPTRQIFGHHHAA
jgi:hypothetical protein